MLFQLFNLVKQSAGLLIFTFFLVSYSPTFSTHSVNTTSEFSLSKVADIVSGDTLSISVFGSTIKQDTLFTKNHTPVISGTFKDQLSSFKVIIQGVEYDALLEATRNWVVKTNNLPNGTYSVLYEGIKVDNDTIKGSLKNALIIDDIPPKVVMKDLTIISGSKPFPYGTVDDTTTKIQVTLTSQVSSQVSFDEDGNWVFTEGFREITGPVSPITFSFIATDRAGNISRGDATLSIVSELTLDSLALVDIYNALEGTNWKNDTNWLKDGISPGDWHGITVEGGRVTKIDLSDNNLKGAFPFVRPGALNLLAAFNVGENSITSLPDLSRLTSLNALNVASNQLQIKDLEGNIRVQTFLYENQASRGGNTIKNVRVGLPLTLEVNAQGTIDSYQWKKNGEAVSAETTSKLLIPSVGRSTGGQYTCEVRYNRLPNLVLLYKVAILNPILDLGGKVTNNLGGLPVDGARVNLFRVAPRRYDTLMIDSTSADGSYEFKSVSALNNYLISVTADTSTFMNTYFGDVIFFRRAKLIQPTENVDTLNIKVLNRPIRSRKGKKRIFGILEEEILDSLQEEASARIEARRRVRLAGVSLYRQKTKLRSSDVDLGLWELVDYTQTDDNGNFSFTNLENEVYLIQIEFPGVPLSDASVVEFDLTNAELEDESIELTALVGEDSIEVEKVIATEILKEYNSGNSELSVYPVPSHDKLFISRGDVSLEAYIVIRDIRGQALKALTLDSGQKFHKLDLSDFDPGVYSIQYYTGNKLYLSEKFIKH